MCYVARGVGEDEVVDVGVFEGAVGVLPAGVYYECEADEGGEGEDDAGTPEA